MRGKLVGDDVFESDVRVALPMLGAADYLPVVACQKKKLLMRGIQRKGEVILREDFRAGPSRGKGLLCTPNRWVPMQACDNCNKHLTR